MFQFSVKVYSRSAQTYFDGMIGEHYRLRVAAPPVDGRANQELLKYLARFFGVARYQVEILHGHTAKIKQIKVDCAVEKAIELLEQQQTLRLL